MYADETLCLASRHHPAGPARSCRRCHCADVVEIGAGNRRVRRDPAGQRGAQGVECLDRAPVMPDKVHALVGAYRVDHVA